MKSHLLLIVSAFVLTVNCFSQNGYEMKPGETINVDPNGNILSSKINPGPDANGNTVKTSALNEDGTFKIPGYVPTGNASVDEQNYKKAKLQLYQNNPEEYHRIYDKPTQYKIVTVVSNEEFLSLPSNKQEYILSHPELYFIDFNSQENK